MIPETSAIQIRKFFSESGAAVFSSPPSLAGPLAAGSSAASPSASASSCARARGIAGIIAKPTAKMTSQANRLRERNLGRVFMNESSIRAMGWQNDSACDDEPAQKNGDPQRR